MPAMVFMAGMILVCCSKDDDDNNNALATSGVLDENTGLRVKSACGYDYVYAEDGTLQYILSGSNCRYEFSYNPNKITHIDAGDMDDSEIFTLVYNRDGTISSGTWSISWNDEKERGSETQGVNCSYDTNGHLTKYVIDYKSSEYNVSSGKSSSERGTLTYVLTWNNHLLQKMVKTDTGNDDDGSYNYVYTYTFTYNNVSMTSYVNKFLQYSTFVILPYGGFMERASFVGLLGNGPAYLPSKMDYKEEEEDYYNGEKKNYEYSGSVDFSYGFNSEGAITYAYYGSTRYTYSYDHVEYSEGDTPFSRAAMEIVPNKSEHGLSIHREHKRHKDALW